MFLEIITPEKKLYAGETDVVRLPGTAGSFEVMLNHAPAISTLKAGKIRVKDADGKYLHFEIDGGVVEVLNNNVVVLVESASLL